MQLLDLFLELRRLLLSHCEGTQYCACLVAAVLNRDSNDLGFNNARWRRAHLGQGPDGFWQKPVKNAIVGFVSRTTSLATVALWGYSVLCLPSNGGSESWLKRLGFQQRTVTTNASSAETWLFLHKPVKNEVVVSWTRRLLLWGYWVSCLLA